MISSPAPSAPPRTARFVGVKFAPTNTVASAQTGGAANRTIAQMSARFMKRIVSYAAGDARRRSTTIDAEHAETAEQGVLGARSRFRTGSWFCVDRRGSAVLASRDEALYNDDVLVKDHHYSQHAAALRTELGRTLSRDQLQVFHQK